MARRRLYFILLLCWVGLTFLLTSIPHLEIPEGIPFWDKGAHFAFYGVTGFLCALWRRESGHPAKRAVLYAVLFVLAVGAVDEIHQLWIPGRSADLLDWVADLLGGGIGAWCALLLPSRSLS
jgi:VanZ family protein